MPGALGGNMVGTANQTQQPMNMNTPLGTGQLPQGQTQSASAIPGTSGSDYLNQAGQMLNQQGNAWYTQNQSPGMGGEGYQRSFDTGPAVDTGRVDAAGMPVQSVGQAQPYMKSMEDAYYQKGASRLDPQYQQRQQGLESQLSAMGLTRGSEAWANEMDRMGRDRNDAYSGLTRESILNSGAEAQRAQGMDIASGNFANQAAQQDYANKLRSQEAYNAAQGQNFGQNQAVAQFGNQALTAEQQASQGWGALAAQDQASRNQLAGSLAGTEASRYGTEQQYQTGLGNQSASRYGSDQQLRGSLAQANATAAAASSHAGAARYAADQQRLSNMLNNETQRYGYDTSANTTMRGQDVTRELGLGQIGEQRYSTDTTAATAGRGQDITRELGLGQIGEQRYATDTNRDTAIRGQDVTARGQDQQYNLGQGRLTLDTNAQNATQADREYWRPIQTQAALGGNMLQPGGQTPVPGASGGAPGSAGTRQNANGQWTNAAGQIWNAITSSWT